MKRLLMMTLTALLVSGLFAGAENNDAIFNFTQPVKFWNWDAGRVQSDTWNAFAIFPSYVFATNWPGPGTNSFSVTATLVSYDTIAAGTDKGIKWFDDADYTCLVTRLSDKGAFEIDIGDNIGAVLLGKIAYDPVRQIVTSGSLDGTFTDAADNGYGICSLDLNHALTKLAATNNALLVIEQFLRKMKYQGEPDITATAGDNGAIAPSGEVQVNFGNAIAFAITPDDGYHIADVLVDGTSVGTPGSYTFHNVIANHTISATFTISNFTLTVASPYGSPAPTTRDYAWNAPVAASVNSPVLCGATTQYVCTGWTGTGSATSGSGTNTSFAITQNSSLTWKWGTNLWLAPSSDANGSLNVAAGWFALGSNVTITATPNSGYQFASWSGDTNCCTLSGNQITVPMNATRAIAAAFAVASQETSSSGLILWNKLDTSNAVLPSVVGPNGTMTAGHIVPGVFGNAIELNVNEQYGVTFPPQIVTQTNGCVEFWAKLVGFPADISLGEHPGLIADCDAQGARQFMLFFNSNDGNANGGLCARVPSLSCAGTGAYGSWTYAAAMGSTNTSDWHHYALVWATDNIPGIAGGAQKVLIFVDGQLNSTSWNGYHGNTMAAPTNGTFGLLCQSGLSSGSVDFDNLKIWNYAKTNFSDRFTEGTVDVSNGGVAHWTFDDGTGKDSAGTNDAVLVGAPAMVSAQSGLAMEATATSYAVADAPGLNVNGWTGITVSVWIKPVNYFTTYGTIISRGTDSSTAFAMSAGSIPVNSVQSFDLYFGASQGVSTPFHNFDPTKTPQPVLGAWYHLVGTYDGQHIRTYVNGVLDSTTTVSVPGTPIWESAGSKTYIGTQSVMPYRGWSDVFFSGDFDDVEIWNRGLSSNEVAQLYVNTSGAVAHWTFDDGTGKDSIGTNDAVLVGSPDMVASESSLAMETKASAYAVADAPGLNVNGWTGITVSVWLKPNAFTTYGAIISRGTDSSGESFAIVAPAVNNWNSEFDVSLSSTQLVGVVFQTFTPSRSPYPVIGNWYHLVATYDGQTMRTYVNGVLDNSTNVSVAGSTLWEPAGSKTYIGTAFCMPERGWSDEYFSGDFDDVAIWNRGLSSNEVAQLYNAGAK